jgi:hypothetical protein
MQHPIWTGLTESNECDCIATSKLKNCTSKPDHSHLQSCVWASPHRGLCILQGSSSRSLQIMKVYTRGLLKLPPSFPPRLLGNLISKI